MSREKLRLLIVDDEENMRHMLGSLLRPQGYLVDEAENGTAALERLKGREYDFILCDVRMPDMDGMEFLQQAGSLLDKSTVIMMSAYGSLDMAIEAMKLGAYDFISKPFKTDEVLLALRKAEEREALKKENQQLRHHLAAIEQQSRGKEIIAKSKEMLGVLSLAERVAPHKSTVLITGESGTGKELIARKIYRCSQRNNKPFIAVNCGALPENLIESELFGYKKGAFTGAERDCKGVFAEADSGTLFLDEIGELPLAMQVKLLRVLQEEEIRPVGASRTQQVDVRIIAATARDLEQEVSAGRFRQDLFYRLNVIRLPLPPLRQRSEDIPVLVDCFLKKYAGLYDVEVHGIAPGAMSRLLTYSWPGNVRELENAMEHAVLMAEKKIILPENLPAELVQGHDNRQRRLDDIFSGFSLKKSRKILEARLIGRALQATRGNKSRAARLLEISYPSLLAKIKEYGLGDQGAGSP
jgi:two-component system response regulator AtoC